MRKCWKLWMRCIAMTLTLALLICQIPAGAVAVPNDEETVQATAPQDVNEATVVAEDVSKREERVKHFRMSDGSFTAVSYNTPVHYRDENGDWADIDNELELTVDADGNEVYRSKNAVVSTAFSTDLESGELLTSSVDDVSVTMQLLDNSPLQESSSSKMTLLTETAVFNRNANIQVLEATKAEEETAAFETDTMESTVLYPDAYPDTDLRYTVYGYSVKEQVIVNAPQQSYRYDFLLKSDELYAVLNDDGSVSLRDKEDTEKYRIPAPYMEDAAGAVSDAVAYTLTETKDGFILTVTADKTWMNAADRVFPVAIDPTLQATTQGDGTYNSTSAIYQSYVMRGDPTASTGGYQHTYVGYSSLPDVNMMYTYVHFNEMPGIPSGSIVSSALFGMYLADYSPVACNEMPLGAYEVTASKPASASSYYNWINTLTWNTRPAFDTDNEIDYAVASDSAEDTYLQWEITELVKKWYAEGTQNRTMVITPSDRTGYSSSKCAVQMFHNYGLSTSPRLVVNYRSITGIESYYTYTNANIGAAGEAYIADVTGQLKIVAPLVGYASTVNPVSINLVYNSDYFAQKSATFPYKPPVELGLDMSVGHGWTLDVIQKMEDDEDANYKKYTDGDGTVHYFRKKDANSSYFYDEDGLGLKVIETSSNNYTMSDEHGNVYKFTGKFLTEKIDAEGNRILIHYSNNRITSVSQKNDGGGEITVAAFTYSSSSNAVTSITDPAGNVYGLEYSSSTGNLANVKKNGRNIARYAYSGRHIVRAMDAESYRAVAFTYYETDDRVASFTEAVTFTSDDTTGARVSVSYPNSSKAVYRDFGEDRTENTSDDILNHILFDYAGRTINAYTTDSAGNILGASNAAYTGYVPMGKKNNRTSRAASVGRTAHQLLRNTGVESTDLYPWVHTGTVVSTAKAHTGLRAIKGTLGSSVINASRVTEQLEAGVTYTFSAYVNTTSVSSFSGDGVYLRVTDNTADEHWDSVPVKYQTSSELEDGWVRLSVSFVAENAVQHVVGVLCDTGVGYFYADDFQLEKGAQVSTYNMLQNSSFEMSDMYGWTLGAKASHYTSLGAGDTDKSIKVTSTPLDTTNPRAHQDITVNLPSSETYVISGWGVGFAVPDNAYTGDSDSATDKCKEFGIRVALYYADDDTPDVYFAPFNSDLSGWQFTGYTIVPRKENKTVERIRVICAYEGNANRAYFDNVCLSREIAQTMTYDDDGNLVSVSSTGLTPDVNTYEGGNLIQKVTGGYGTYTYRHTYEENPHRITSVVGHYLTQTFGNRDDMGNVKGTELKNESHPDSGTMISKATYSGSGNLQTSVIDENGNTTSFEYGSQNNHVVYGTPSKITYPNGTAVTQTIDDLGRTTKNTIANTAKVEYTYGSKGLTEIKRTDLASSEQLGYTFSYDAFGNMTNAQVGNGLLAMYLYGEQNGALEEMLYANGGYTEYTYDTLGRPKTTQYSGGKTLTYTYDGNGQLSRLKESGNGGSAILSYFQYDTLGRLISNRKQIGYTTILHTNAFYNEKNRLVKQSWRVGKTNAATYTEEYGYNGYDGLIRRVYSAAGSTIAIERDTLRRVASVSNGVYNKTFTYRTRDDGHATNQIKTVNYEDLAVPLTYGYTYDSMGNIKTVTDPIDGNKTYTYDNQGQMTKEVIGSATYTYTYDKVGNILTANKDGVAHTYTYGDNSWGDLLTKYDGVDITYDAIGNPLSYYNGKNWSFTWVEGRTLSKATSGNTTVSYTYDKTNGMRLSKKVGSKTYEYYYADSQLLRMTVSDGVTMDFFYDHNGQPYAVKYNGTTYYYVLNQQGDVVRIVSAGGDSQGTYRYDAWGNILYATDSTLMNNNPLRYRGYVYDTETGFYYLSSRYYDPEIGRFINADSLIDNRGIITQNLFQYCGNNPVNNADPSGNLFGAIVGIGLLVIGMVATLSGCSSKPAASPSKPSTPSKPSNPSSSSSPTTSPHIPTPQEKSYAATVYAEAGGQNKRSKQAVAHVMNNRIGTRSSWTDIESVISAKYQFAGYNSPMYQAAMNYYNNGICNNSIEQAAMDECLAVVIPIYSGAESDITGGALYFHSFANPSDWAYHNSYTQVYVPGTEKFWFYK